MPEGIRVPLVGRRHELTRIIAGVHGEGPAPKVLLIEGESGIGKTRLLQEATLAAAARGLTVLSGIGDDLEQARSFGLLLEAVESGAAAGGRSLRDLVEGPHQSSSHRRLAVIDWCVAFFDEAAAGRHAVLVLDDLHWADTETLNVLRALVRRSPHLPLTCIVATRPASQREELERLVEAVEAANGLITLGPLDDAAVSELIEHLSASTASPSVSAGVSSAGGNPFFLIEILSSEPTELDSRDMSSELRRSVLRRVMHLSEDARRTLRFASLLGGSIDAADVATIADRSTIDLVPLIDEAVKAGVLEERDGALAFRHDLVRQAIYGDMPVSVRMQLHRDAARAFTAAGASATRVATHLGRAADRGDGEAVSWLRRAAAEEALQAPTVAADMLARAAELETAETARERIQVDRIRALAWAGRSTEALALATDVLAELRDLDLAADIRASLGETLFLGGRLTEAADHLERAAVDGSGPNRALSFAEAALGRLVGGQLAQAEDLVVGALAEGRSLDDRRALSLATGVSTLLAVARADGTALDLGREAVRIADGDIHGEAHRYGAHVFLGLALTEADRFDESARVFRRGIALDDLHGVMWALPCYYILLGSLRFVAGDWDDAVAELETALAILDDMDSTLLGPLAHGLLAHIALHRDDRAAVERELVRGETELAGTAQIGADWILMTRALLTDDDGDAPAAAAITTGVWALAEAMGFRLGVRYFGPTNVRMALRQGDRDAARRVSDSVSSVAAAMGTASMAATALHCRGLLDADSDALQQAVVLLREVSRPLELGAACEDAASAAERAGDTELAAGLVREAIDVYQRIGATRDVRRASALLAGGVRRTEPKRPASGWASLSPTERRVVTLVAEGLSNAGIAERLTVSRRTVETHVYHLFQKLAVSSRVELALLAAREGSGPEVQ